MANPHRGEVDVEIGERKYLLSFSADALAELEDRLGLSIEGIGRLLDDGDKIRVAHWRTMFTCALQDNHEDIDDKAARALFKKLSITDAIRLTGKAYGLALNGLAEYAKGKKAAEAASPPEPGPSNEPTGPASSTPGPTSEDQKRNSGG